MDATRPTSTICNSPSLSASASLCCYGTSSRDQDCTNITSLPSTHIDEAHFNFFFSACHISGCCLQESAQNLGSAPWSGAAQMHGWEHRRALFAFNCSCWQGGQANTSGLPLFPPHASSSLPFSGSVYSCRNASVLHTLETAWQTQLRLRGTVQAVLGSPVSMRVLVLLGNLHHLFAKEQGGKCVAMSHRACPQAQR